MHAIKHQLLLIDDKRADIFLLTEPFLKKAGCQNRQASIEHDGDGNQNLPKKRKQCRKQKNAQQDFKIMRMSCAKTQKPKKLSLGENKNRIQYSGNA